MVPGGRAAGGAAGWGVREGATDPAGWNNAASICGGAAAAAAIAAVAAVCDQQQTDGARLLPGSSTSVVVYRGGGRDEEGKEGGRPRGRARALLSVGLLPPNQPRGRSRSSEVRGVAKLAEAHLHTLRSR